jgi:hypothetical protein
MSRQEYLKEYQKTYRLSHKEEMKSYQSKYNLSNREKLRLEGIKKRAKEKGLEFNLELEDIVYPENCPILNIKLERQTGHLRGNSPSVDRINPAKGYTKDNVQVISQKANAMKHNATPEELILFAEWIFRTYKKGGERCTST